MHIPAIVLGSILVAVFTIVLLVVILLVFEGASQLFYHGSGWKQLCERYPIQAEPPGQKFTGQTIRLNNNVRYRFSTTVVLGPQGLYLDQAAVFLHKPMLIPWHEIHPAGETVIYWRKARVLSIANPQIATISVYPSLYGAMAPYLKV